MTEVFIEREWDRPLTKPELDAMVTDTQGCMELYRVDWQESLISADRRRLLCRFRGPDAESVRLALRSSDAARMTLWPGTIHVAPGLTGRDLLAANVVVRRVFDEPASLEAIQAIEDAGIGCLQAHGVRFIRTFFAIDRRRMICLYNAPDAESVRIAQRQARMPLDSAWAFQRFAPDSL